MPKDVDVLLENISYKHSPTHPGDELEIDGRILGHTFNENPHVEKSQADIFTFPDGPIRIAQGQAVSIPQDSTHNPARLVLFISGHDIPGSRGEFMDFGGELDDFGKGFKTLHTGDLVTPLDEPQKHQVEIARGNRKILLDFTVTVRHAF